MIVASVFHAWWFVVLPLALIGAWGFPYFIEMIIAGIIYDSLFGFVPEMGVWGYIGAIVSIVFFVLMISLKKVVRR